MHVFNVTREAAFDPKNHVEKILGTVDEGDVTVACWEPGQISPYHCHPHATEIYFCFEGGGTMRTPTESVAVRPGLRRPSARRIPRIRQRAAAHPAVSRALRVGYGFAPYRMARPPGLDAERGRRRVLSPASGHRLNPQP